MMNTRLYNQAAATLLSALIAFPAPLWAQAAGQGTIVEALEISEDRVVIKLSEEAQYKSFMTANPPRLVVEIVGAEYQAGAKSFAGKGTILKGVRGGQFKPKPDPVSRIVLDLDATTTYTVNPDGANLVVSLTAAAKDSGPAPASTMTQAEGAPKAPASPSPAAKPKVSAPAAARTPAVAPVVAVPAAEKGAFSTENSPELAAVAMKKDVSKTEVDLPPAAPVPARSSDSAPARSGGDIINKLPRDLVTLDFDNTDIRDIIKLLAAKANINMIYGADVTGTLSLHLTDVPFNEAFRTILTMMGLQTMQVGEKILRVLTPAAFAKTQTAAATATRVLPLNYATASEVITTINAVRLAEGRTGSALADVKTNSVILTESVEGLVSSERLVASLDVRPKQVLIEAKLVEVGLNNSLHYGIQWDATHVDQGKLGKQSGTNTIGTTAGPGAGALSMPNALGQPYDVNATNPPGLVGGSGFGASGRGTGVNLAASNIFGALTLGRITNNYFINATLTAAAAQGKVKVLSDPKIATVNNVAANINVTTSIPYVTSNVASTGVQTQTVSYAVTGIQLSVTPTINADGRITLKINPTVSQPSATAAASVTTGAPAIDSRTANTTVVVKDGETIVIGGLISDSVSNQIAKIPILGDIPILGWLFKKKSVVRNRAELLIFVTPKIITD